MCNMSRGERPDAQRSGGRSPGSNCQFPPEIDSCLAELIIMPCFRRRRQDTLVFSCMEDPRDFCT